MINLPKLSCVYSWDIVEWFDRSEMKVILMIDGAFLNETISWFYGGKLTAVVPHGSISLVADNHLANDKVTCGIQQRAEALIRESISINYNSRGRPVFRRGLH